MLSQDVSALIRTAGEAKSPVSIIEQVERVGHERKLAGGSVRNKTIGVLGLTFKPNTDDMRDAPSLVIVPMLQERGATIRACDPQGRRQAEPLLPGITWCDSAVEAADGADLLVVVTEWNEFRALDLGAVRSRMRGTIVVDLRNVFDAGAARKHGFAYLGIGRGHPGLVESEREPTGTSWPSSLVAN